MRKNLALMLASAALFSTTMVGCTTMQMAPRSSISASDTSPSRIEEALAKKDFARALTQAELLVAATPRDAASRVLLGRAYLANGRFASARAAFTSTLMLGNVEARTIVSLALCEIGLGNVSAARELLLDKREHLPAADYGLAMAMANEPQEGVRALLEAVRMPDATAQTRQNLAYALALGGAWGQARLVAGQDLTAKAADRRIAQWSQLGVVDNPQQRVVALIGIAPRGDDAGMPVHLALDAAGPASAVQVAAEPVAQPRTARDDTAMIESVVPQITPPQLQILAPQSDEQVALNERAAQMDFAKAPLISDPMRTVVHSALRQPRSAETQPLPKKPVEEPRPVETASLYITRDGSRKSAWAVQLGAFNSDTVARDKWTIIRQAWPSLRALDESYSVLPLKGRTFHRLAVSGFGDYAEASALCRWLLSKGQACFVRRDNASGIRMAASDRAKSAKIVSSGRPRQQIAAR